MPLGVEHVFRSPVPSLVLQAEYNFDAVRRWAQVHPFLSRHRQRTEYNFDAGRRWALRKRLRHVRWSESEYNFDAGRRWAQVLAQKLNDIVEAEYNFDAVRRWTQLLSTLGEEFTKLNITLMPLGDLGWREDLFWPKLFRTKRANG